MSLAEVRRRLPVVASLPSPGNRSSRPDAPVRGPRWAIWELTLACDQKCAHCGPRAGHRRPDELSTEECLAIVQELKGLGCGEVVLIGGEAYLRNDFILIIRAIREAGMSCTMTTGAYNLTPERIEAMIAAGLSSVTISIDGLEATHDALRGVPGSWRRAFQAMHDVRAAGGKVACNTQINARTREELAPLLELLAPAGVHSWQLQITVPHGNAADHPEILLQPHMFLDLFATLDGLITRCTELKVRLCPADPSTSTSADPTTTTTGTGSTGSAASTGEDGVTTTGSSSTSTTVSSDDAGTDDAASGCACRSSSGQAPAGLLWTGLLLGLLRRSRVSARGTC